MDSNMLDIHLLNGNDGMNPESLAHDCILRLADSRPPPIDGFA